MRTSGWRFEGAVCKQCDLLLTTVSDEMSQDDTVERHGAVPEALCQYHQAPGLGNIMQSR